MFPSRRFAAGVAVVSLSIFGIGRALAQAVAAPPPVSPASTQVTVLDFTDFECPYSAEMFFTLRRLEAKYPGHLNVVYKQSPLVSIHPDAPLAHRAALAASRQGKYDAMAELLYANQAHLEEASLFAYARQLHLDMPRFRRDFSSKSVQTQLATDMQESEAFGIGQTPTLFINGKSLTGTQPEEVLANLIDKGNPQAAVESAASATPPLDAVLQGELRANASATRGSASAPLTIVEFTDFQCPFCRSAVEPMEKLMAARGRDVHWIIHSFPLDFHVDSELANEAALAAGDQGKFWEMHDLLFAHQSALKAPDLRLYAEQLHLDMTAFDAALATHKFAGQIAADRALGTRAGVSGTPTFIVDGQLLIGARSLAELNQLADSHIASRSGSAASPSQVAVVLPSAGVEHQVLGPETGASLTLTWFTDVRSPLAGKQAELVRSLATKYNGRIRVLFKAFPVASREDSRLGAGALFAALQQGKFWEMYDALAQRRDTLDRARIVATAAELHLEPQTFLASLESSAALVNTDVEEATRRGVQGAPVIFLNAQRVDGLQREEFYTTLLEGELKQTPGSQASIASVPGTVR